MSVSQLNAIVTGGSRGIGEACALALAKEGANVAIAVSKSVASAEAVVEKIKKQGVDAFAMQCDISKPQDVQKMVSEVARRWGSIDILLNNAGIAQCLPAVTLPLEDWQRMLEINLTGVFLMTQAVGKIMIEKQKGKGGSIINIASMSGHIVNLPQRQMHYNTAKAGVLMMTKSLAVEWAEHRIRVNSISPGYIKTALNEGPVVEKWLPTWLERTPLGRMGDPEDVAEAVVYLASARAKFVTGTDIIIDGGYSCP